MDVNCVFFVVSLGIIADHTEYEAVVSENDLTKWKETISIFKLQLFPYTIHQSLNSYYKIIIIDKV